MLDKYFQNCMYFSSALLNRAITKMAEDTFKATGLSPTYAFLLLAVQEKPGISQKELGEVLHLTPSTITRFIEKLLYKGLITSHAAGKLSLIELTQAGVELMPVIKQAWKELKRRYSEILGEEAGIQLTKMLHDAGRDLGQKV
ncbi:MarR family winged helix-turn-helix transcriptional regulator [Paenibacillus silvisoli]|uniref:MarR family winged helix-turn-helix transcriptional regulator n=1 Tax=Paenibacillus silvisoli TaxID=3110539 RepID=UPI0028057A8A|nr:MarR family transcriptional regulator [Paenibacillus silvisoli]